MMTIALRRRAGAAQTADPKPSHDTLATRPRRRPVATQGDCVDDEGIPRPFLLLGAALVVLVLVEIAWAARLARRPTFDSSSGDGVIGSEHPVAARQAFNNDATRDRWELFAPHRARVMDAVLDAARHARGDENGDTGVHGVFFGPGNLNDISLKDLLASGFETMTLVDIDPRSVEAAVDRQLEAASVARGENDEGTSSMRERVAITPAIDLTNIHALTSTWADRYDKRPPAREYRAARAAASSTVDESAFLSRLLVSAPSAAGVSVASRRGYDVSVSLCLFSQLMHGISLVLDESDRSSFLQLVAAVLKRHAELVVRSLRPGGCGLLVVDFVNSDDVPALRDVAEGDTDSLEGLAQQAENDRTFMSGTARYTILGLLNEGGPLWYLVEDVQLLPTWKWALSDRKDFLVYGVRFRRRGE